MRRATGQATSGEITPLAERFPPLVAPQRFVYCTTTCTHGCEARQHESTKLPAGFCITTTDHVRPTAVAFAAYHYADATPGDDDILMVL